jgi:TPR repeat protein
MGVNVRKRKGMYRYLTFGLLTFLLSISMAVTAFGGQYEDATAAYERGDYGEAYRLFEPLAEQGHANAQFNLGVMYYKGQGVPQDYAEAAKWYRKTAEQGDAKAQFNLGFLYENGRGVPQNYAEAAKWYRKAAEQGNIKAQVNLGVMYYKGQGVSQNYILAHMWINLGVSRLTASEKETREIAENIRDTLSSIMTPFQIAEAQRLAREWKLRKEAK